jgi:uncharacterized protein YcbX
VVMQAAEEQRHLSIRQHTSAYVSMRTQIVAMQQRRSKDTSACVSIRQHSSAYVSIRQHTSAYVSIWAQIVVMQAAEEQRHLSIRQLTSAYVSMRTQIVAMQQRRSKNTCAQALRAARQRGFPNCCTTGRRGQLRPATAARRHLRPTPAPSASK